MTHHVQHIATTAEDGQMLIEEIRGPFYSRRYVSNEYLAVRDVCRRRVEEDIAVFARMNAPRSILELTEVFDPFEGFSGEGVCA